MSKALSAWPEPGEYDPHDHREIEKPTTNFETLMHYLKAIIGTGILVLPKAFANAGFIVAIIGSLIVGFMCAYCMHLLIRTQYQFCRKEQVPRLSYGASAQIAFQAGPACFPKMGKCANGFVMVFLMMYQIAACSAYVIFVSNNLKELNESFCPDLIWDNRVYMVMQIVPFLLINYIRSLKYLAPLSLIANILQYASFSIIFYYLFSDVSSYTLEHCTMVAPIAKIPSFIGGMFFSLSAIGVVMALEVDMKTPKKFRGYFGVLNQGSTIVLILYIGIASVAYLKYGDDVAGSLTSNIPVEDTAGKALRIFYLIAISFSHALQCYVALDIIWNNFLKFRISDPNKYIAEYIMRTVTVLITFLFAALLPKFHLVVNLIGVICISCLGIAFPAILEICLYYAVGYQRCNYILIRDIAIVIIGCCTFVTGIYSTLFT